MCIDVQAPCRIALAARAQRKPLRGFTLIELIVFIVVVSTALAGVLLVLDTTVRASGAPVIRKQMLAIAESVMEEVQLQPFTWCNPADANAVTATGAASCTSNAYNPLASPLGSSATALGETRLSSTNPLNNVADYNGQTITAGLNGQSFPSGYSATVAVIQEALGPVASAVPASAALRIVVTVSKGSDSIVLEGYRTRYAPNLMP